MEILINSETESRAVQKKLLSSGYTWRRSGQKTYRDLVNYPSVIYLNEETYDLVLYGPKYGNPIPVNQYLGTLTTTRDVVCTCSSRDLFNHGCQSARGETCRSTEG